MSPDPLIVIDGGLACNPRPTGVEIIAQEVLRRLLEEPGGLRIRVYLPANASPPFEMPAGVSIVRRPEMNTALRPAWIAYQARRDRPSALLTFSHRAPRWTGCPVVAIVYDTIFDTYPDCYPPAVPERAHREVAQTCRLARMVLTLSADSAGRLVADYGLDKERVRVISCAAGDIFRPGPVDREALALDFGIEGSYVLCIGRPDRRKNYARVLEAVEALRSEGAFDGRLLLVGPRGSLAGVDDSESVVTTGYIEHDRLPALYRGALALAYPSLAEGFGLPILEAMSCGTPVVTSNRSSMPEVAGDAALLVDPESVESIKAALQRLATDAQLRDDLTRRGRERAAKFTWEAVAARVRAALVDCCRSPAASA